MRPIPSHVQPHVAVFACNSHHDRAGETSSEGIGCIERRASRRVSSDPPLTRRCADALGWFLAQHPGSPRLNVNREHNSPDILGRHHAIAVSLRVLPGFARQVNQPPAVGFHFRYWTRRYRCDSLILICVICRLNGSLNSNQGRF